MIVDDPDDSPTSAATSDVTVDVVAEDPRWADVEGAADLTGQLADVARAALAGAGGRWRGRAVEMGVVLADDALVQRLNRDYRGKDRSTNVLSFALADDADHAAGETADPGPPLMLGEVYLAYETVAAEAAEQNKTILDHTRHLVVHGVLHLIGYDHQEKAEAETMERLEAAVLDRFGVADPYADPPPKR